MRLRLPASSANLGPGFDAAAIALDHYLTVEAEIATEFSICASGRNADACEKLDGNLLVDTYIATLRRNGRGVLPLAMSLHNDIPMGMGMGSSAAARLAAIAMASRFGELGWSGQRILEEACAVENHPDNVAACWLGGFVTAATRGAEVIAAKIDPPAAWTALVVLPQIPLATERARSVLPDRVPLCDAVYNLQRSALLMAAFAQGRGDWLREAMSDRLHQPYRSELCPLLPLLLPLAGTRGVMGVALSGAGPAVLMLVESEEAAKNAELLQSVMETAVQPVEVLFCRIEGTGAELLI